MPIYPNSRAVLSEKALQQGCKHAKRSMQVIVEFIRETIFTQRIGLFSYLFREIDTKSLIRFCKHSDASMQHLYPALLPVEDLQLYAQGA